MPVLRPFPQLCQPPEAFAFFFSAVPVRGGFSALPYTPQQLEQAAHREELPVPARTVVTLCGAMRGMGGIDSWGSDVEEEVRIRAEEDHKVSFQILL